MKAKKVNGLYAVTPDLADTGQLHALVEASLQGGAAVVQYRNKLADAALRLEQAQALLPLCRQYAVPFIINDHLDLCLTLDADGVHLGGDDGNLAQARTLLGPAKMLGASCYNRFELAQQAQAQGADYIAFGACFDSATKPAAVRAPLELLSRAHAELGLPVVAIGGITHDNAKLAIEAGADAIAVIGALYSASDVKLAAQQFSNLFNHNLHHDLTQSAAV